MDMFNSLEKILKSSDREFRSLFWIDKISFIKLYELLNNDQIKISHLLIFFYFIKNYPTMDNLSFQFQISQKTAKKRLDYIRGILLDFSKDKIKDTDRFNQQPLIIDNKIKIYSVLDTSLFPIRRPTHFEEIYYSTKHKKHGIKYEVGCRISDGKIILVSEDYYCGTEHDLEISRKSGLISNEIYKFEENEKILADKGYIGESLFFLCPKKGDRENLSKYQKEYESIILPYRQIIENVFKDPTAFSYFYEADGTPKSVGTILKNPELAKTFLTLTTHGADAFYQGEIAYAIINKIHTHQKNPGLLTTQDLLNYHAKIRQPVCSDYKAWRICGFPPPSSGGITIAQILGILESKPLQQDIAQFKPTLIQHDTR
ncbi:hypothetical protein ACTFIZ_000193 [Dictyostelium cf. discoideum]